MDLDTLSRPGAYGLIKYYNTGLFYLKCMGYILWHIIELHIMCWFNQPTILIVFRFILISVEVCHLASVYHHCFLPTVMGSASFMSYKLLTLPNIISSPTYIHCVFVLLYLKVMAEIYYFVILDKVSNKSIVPWVCNTYGRNVHFNNALYWNGCPNQCHMPLSYSIFGVIGHVTHVFCCANSMSHGGHESLD